LTRYNPHEPRNDWQGAIAMLSQLCTRNNVDLIAIGNGTASRETDKLAGDLIARLPELKITKVMVSEAGASVYSASQLAADEFPDLDVSLRGAVSIARRLQDPLAELVKIEPKAIGVGQYQHDVNQSELARSLSAAVEDCVNLVGVDVNTASAPLLASVAGLNATIAQNIVHHRNENGAFKKRSEIKKVARLGPKAFEQAAGFLRIMNGPNLLDASAVHPEAYAVVERIAKATKRPVKAMIGDSAFLMSLNPEDFADEQFGATSWRSWKSPAAIRVLNSAPQNSPKGSRRSQTWTPACCWKASSPMSRLSARSSTSAFIRTASSTSPNWPIAS
jgi:uncharacterized protein